MTAASDRLAALRRMQGGDPYIYQNVRGFSEDDPHSRVTAAGIRNRRLGSKSISATRRREDQARRDQSDLVRLHALWSQVKNEFPDLTSGVHANFLPDTDPMVNGVLARGSGVKGDKQVFYNTKALGPMKDAKDVLVKELGQANVNSFVNNLDKALAYHHALGYNGPAPNEDDARTLLAYTNTVPRGGAARQGYTGGGTDIYGQTQGATTPEDYYGYDFARSLGYGHTTVLDQLPDLARLQRGGVLPRQMNSAQRKKARTTARRAGHY